MVTILFLRSIGKKTKVYYMEIYICKVVDIFTLLPDTSSQSVQTNEIYHAKFLRNVVDKCTGTTNYHIRLTSQRSHHVNF